MDKIMQATWDIRGVFANLGRLSKRADQTCKGLKWAEDQKSGLQP